MIPEAAVEAAALGIHIQGGVNVTRAREYARAALEAAAPHMIADAWDAGYIYSYDQERGGNGELPIPVPEYLADDLVQWNPYRPTP